MVTGRDVVAVEQVFTKDVGGLAFLCCDSVVKQIIKKLSLHHTTNVY
jgi:hypothetical protein